MTQCNAKAKSTGQQCRRNAMSGSTKCYVHGGATPRGVASPHYRHGRYSKYVPKDLEAKIQELDSFNILELADELQTQRALIAEYLERYRHGGNLEEGSISAIIAWLNSIGIMVERIYKIRNETALTGAEISYMKSRTADIVAKYIPDKAQQQAFIRDLFQLSEPAQLTDRR